MQVFHQSTTTDESGNTDSTLDVNGWFLVLAVMATVAVVDSVMEGLTKIRAKKLQGPGSNSTCSH